VLAGGFWLKAKGKLGKVKDLARETYELVDTAIAAVDDNKIEKSEVEAIKKEAQDVKAAWQSLIGK